MTDAIGIPRKRRTVVDDSGVVHYAFGRHSEEHGHHYTTLCDEHDTLTNMAANLGTPEMLVDGSFEPKRRWIEEQLSSTPATCALCLGHER